MNIRIVGGDFKQTPKRSSVIDKIAKSLSERVHGEMGYGHTSITNGGLPEQLEHVSISGHDLILWMPNVDNDIDKVYPKKDVGSILICSKVIHSERTVIDAISRIFKMNGNAVIAIFPGEQFSFKLIDALGNVWYNGYDISKLSEAILSIYSWTKASKRLSTKHGDFKFAAAENINLPKLVELTKIVADKFEAMGGRFFGNTSTRCMKMFPSERLDSEYILVSKRNVDKQRLTEDDFVKVKIVGDGDNLSIQYLGEHKPSVDTPIQSKLYYLWPNINFMIHGHSYIEGAPFTENYYPCGDLREEVEISNILQTNTTFGAINIINHGFLLYASHIEDLEQLVSDLKFTEREIGYEEVNNSLVEL